MDNKEQCLAYLKPIWDAKGWNYKALKEKSYNQILGIYLGYKKDPKKVNEIINGNKPKYEQIKLAL